MLTNRQAELLKLLIKAEQPRVTSFLAQQLECSEKTVRNDLKQIDDWLQIYPDAALVRKPSVGVTLDAAPSVEQDILFQLKHSESGQAVPIDLDVRVLLIIRGLLENEKPVTLQQLAGKFFVSRATISHDLNEVEKRLSAYGLELVRKPRTGIFVKGNEKQWRLGLSDVVEKTSRNSYHLSNHQLSEIRGVLETYELVLIEDNIRNLERSLPYNFADEAVINLIVHIAIAVKRIKIGKKIDFHPEELKKLQLYDEYQLAEKFAREIEKLFSIKIPESEIGYVTLHLLGAKIHRQEQVYPGDLKRSFENIDSEALSISCQFIEEISSRLHQFLNKDRELLIGLSVHFHSVLNRLRYGLTVSNPLLNEIKQNYRFSFELVYAALPDIEKNIGVSIPEDEAAYLALHIQAAIERSGSGKNEFRKVLIVCSTGTGTSKLIAAKIKRYFPQISVSATVSLYELKQALAKYQPDFIISTVDIKLRELPVFVITPLLSESERDRIDRFISGEHDKRTYLQKGHYPILKSLLTEKLILFDLPFNNRYEVIEYLSSQLFNAGFVAADYAESAARRDYRASTAIGGGIAIPHGDPAFIEKSAICVAVFRDPIEWEGNRISFVFMLALNLSEKNEAERLFEELSTLEGDAERLDILQKQTSSKAFIDHL